MARVSFEFACPAGTPPRRRRVRETLNRGIALLLVFTIGCASQQTVVVHSEPRVISESEERLVAESQELEDGIVALQVFRECDRVLEQDFWKMQVSGGTARRGDFVASLGPENDKALSAFMSAVAAGLVEGTARALSELIVFIRLLVESASGEVAGAFRPGEPEPGHERVSVGRRDTIRTLCPAIVLASIDLKTVVLLGPQPTGGYRLDRATLERFGSKGTRVSVFDGLLETEVLLGNPR